MSLKLNLKPLERLCEIISENKDDYYEESALIYKSHPYFDSGKIFPLHHYLETFKEIHWKIVLKRISEENPDLKLRNVNTKKIRNSKYLINEDPLNRVYVSIKTKKGGLIEKARYENFLYVSEHLAIIESFLSGVRKIGREKISLLGRIMLNRPRYVAIAPKDYIFPGSREKFKKEGGIIVPWDIKKDEFVKNVKSSLERSGIRYTV